ncbi:MAG: flagellar basal body P-ring formation chaperone FlgA [Nitrospiraceae bacterium]|nr:flagellar basal body P-ring formation chaperone FlgA [Nitrospiraceae bacterium]
MKRTAALLLMFLLLTAPAIGGGRIALADGLVNMTAVLRAYIDGRYHWSNVEINDLVIDSGRPDCMLDGLPESVSLIKDPPGKTVFGLNFAGGRKETATATVTGYETVVKSTHLLRTNSVVGPEDVSSSLVDVSRLPKDGFFKEDSQVVGKVLTCSVGAGVTILGSMVSKAPMVERGHRVTIMVDSPGFRITTPGELVGSARVGSYAKVMNTSSRKMLSGILVDENTVLIQEDPGSVVARDSGGYQ